MARLLIRRQFYLVCTCVHLSGGQSTTNHKKKLSAYLSTTISDLHNYYRINAKLQYNFINKQGQFQVNPL